MSLFLGVPQNWPSGLPSLQSALEAASGPHLAGPRKSSKAKKGSEAGRRGRRRWRRSSPRAHAALPTWGSRLAEGRRFRPEGGTRRSTTSGARRSCRICRAQWRLHCFTRGCLEMQPFRPLESRRCAHPGRGKSPGGFPQRCWGQIPGPALGERI